MLDEQQRAGAGGLAGSHQVQMIAALVREDDPLEWQAQACARRAVRVGGRTDIRMPLDREHPRIRVVDQVRAQRLLPRLLHAPFDDERHGHPLLHRGKSRGCQLVEDAREIESSVGALPGLITENSESYVHRARKMPGGSGLVKWCRFGR